MKKKSPKQILVDKIYDQIRAILKIKHGDYCQICGRKQNNIGLFHILPKGKYPSLRFHEQNLLLACWLPCHYQWHHQCHNEAGYKRIEKEIQKLRGEYYWNNLLLLNKIQPRLTMTYLQVLLLAKKEELKELRNEEIYGNYKLERKNL